MTAFLKRLGRATLVIALCLLALAALGFWYVSRGPLDLGLLKPRVQQIISRAVPGLEVDVARLSASRDALRRAVLIKAENVTLRHRLLAQPATVREMTLLVPQSALVGDDPTPRDVSLSGVRARMVWTPAQVRQWLAGGDDTLPPRLKWLPGLDQLQIKDVELELAEASSALPRGANQDVLTIAHIKAERGLLLARKEIQLTLKAGLVEARGPARLSLSGTGKAIPNGQWALTLDATTESPQRYVRAFLPDAEMPSRLPKMRLSTELAATDAIRGKTKITILPGRFVWAPHYVRGLEVQKGEVNLHWANNAPIIAMPRAMLNVEGAALTLSGNIHSVVLERSKLQGSFKALTIAQLKTLWPAGAAEGGRTWVAENITGGGIRNGMFALMPARQKGADPKVTLDFAFDNLTAHYRRPMPALMAAFGKGRLTNDRLVLDVSKGKINGVTVPKAQVQIGPFAEKIQYADVDLSLAGKLPQLLAVLDSEPLDFISRYGLKPAEISGTASGTVKLKIPLLKAVTLDEISFSATAQTKNAQVPDIYAGKALEKADLTFAIGREGLNAQGNAFLNGNPLQITWSENFTGTLASPTRYEVTTRTSISALAGLGIDMQALAMGDFPATLVLEGRGGTISTGSFSADLANVQLTVPPFGIVKPAGVVGRATGNFAQVGRTVAFSDIQVASSPVSARLTATVPIDAGRSEFKVSSFVYGNNKLQGTIAFGAEQPMSVAIAGGDIDLRPELTAWRQTRTAKEKPAAKRVITASALAPPGAPELLTEISGKIDRIRLLNNIEYSNVLFDTQLTGELLSNAMVKGRLGEKATSHIQITSQSGSRKLYMMSDDAGLLAQALDVYANARGGKLVVDADFSGRDKALTITGKATMTDFRIVNAPGLARALTIASLTGLTDTLRGRGIEFKNADAPFSLKRGIIDVRKASAVGPGLGITLEGQVSRATGQTNMRGTIIPSYGLNAAVGKIPLVGKMITGGKHQGLIGFRYRITGTMADPKVDVTASTGFAPGFLRGLFKGKEAVIDPAFEEAAAAN